MILEIYTDASIKTFGKGTNNERTFGCAGAICPRANKSRYEILPDTTNNKAELIAVFNGVLLADEIRQENSEYDEIYIYSDSKFSIYGLTQWIYSWLDKKDSNGILHGSNGEPVKNQELFAMILAYLVNNKLRINFRHQAGHINTRSEKSMNNANTVFKSSNGYSLFPEDIYKISLYNDMVDKNTRSKLDGINPDKYPVVPNDKLIPAGNLIPFGISQYCIGGRQK